MLLQPPRHRSNVPIRTIQWRRSSQPVLEIFYIIFVRPLFYNKVRITSISTMTSDFVWWPNNVHLQVRSFLGSLNRMDQLNFTNDRYILMDYEDPVWMEVRFHTHQYLHIPHEALKAPDHWFSEMTLQQFYKRYSQLSQWPSQVPSQFWELQITILVRLKYDAILAERRQKSDLSYWTSRLTCLEFQSIARNNMSLYSSLTQEFEN